MQLVDSFRSGTDLGRRSRTQVLARFGCWSTSVVVAVVQAAVAHRGGRRTP